jgi:hypothetical protein
MSDIDAADVGAPSLPNELQRIGQLIKSEKSGQRLLWVRTTPLLDAERALPAESEVRARGLDLDPVECARGMVQLYRSYRELVNERNTGAAALGASAGLALLSWLPQALTAVSASPVLQAYPKARLACRGLALGLALCGSVTEARWQTGNKDKAQAFLHQAFTAQQALFGK